MSRGQSKTTATSAQPVSCSGETGDDNGAPEAGALCRQAVDLLLGAAGGVGVEESTQCDSVYDELAAAYVWLGVCVHDKNKSKSIEGGSAQVRTQ